MAVFSKKSIITKKKRDTLKAAGFTHFASATIHPKNGGDDRTVSLDITIGKTQTIEDLMEDIKAKLKRVSAVPDDFVIMKL